MKMKCRKLPAVLLTAALALAVTACGGSTNNTSSETRTTESKAQEASNEATTQANAKVNDSALDAIAKDLSSEASTGTGAIQASTTQGYEVGYLDENNNYICSSLGYQLTGGSDFEFFDVNGGDITESGQSDRQDDIEKSFDKNHVAIELEGVSDDTMVILYVIDPLYSISDSSATVAANIAKNAGLKDTGESRNVTVLGTSDTVELYTDGNHTYALEKIASSNGIYSLVEVITTGDVQDGFDVVQNISSDGTTE